jgi:hypothetical protein
MSEEKIKLKQEISKLNEDIQEIISKIEMMSETAKSTRPELKTCEEFVECVKKFRKLQDEKDAKLAELKK